MANIRNVFSPVFADFMSQ